MNKETSITTRINTEFKTKLEDRFGKMKISKNIRKLLKAKLENELFDLKDVFSFGEYLLSNERKELFKSHPLHSEDTLESRLSQVWHSDFENWKQLNKK